MESSHRLHSFDVLRAVAALLVVFYHLDVIIGLGFSVTKVWGTVGVGIFFIISGYLIFSSFQNNLNMHGLRGGLYKYLVNRFFRIIPAYYFNFAMLLLIVPFVITYYPFVFSGEFLKQIIAHVSFSAYLIYKDNGFGLNGSYWTLSIEMLWYIIVPLLVIFFNSRVKLTILFILSFGYLAALDLGYLDFYINWIKPDPQFNVSYESMVGYMAHQLPGQFIFFIAGIGFLKLAPRFNFMFHYASKRVVRLAATAIVFSLLYLSSFIQYDNIFIFYAKILVGCFHSIVLFLRRAMACVSMAR